ncbi:hypothetical protein [Nonomuraea guangzhouensis]|uniref:Uncharacterized protein n=1 Tax=Nonomuraea guangzhouensis TaxID=1291555 RepID=A0ABW4GX94_9ACTN|nr:hypothetical protein [Nonomuraea guangzhouensis]
MALTIDPKAGRMSSTACDTMATRSPDGTWTVTGREGVYDYNHAITALTVDELRASGVPASDPLVQMLESELREASE